MLPVLDVAGSPRERGRMHGEALREKVELAVALYAQHTGSTPGTGDAVRRADYLAAAWRWTPDAVEELRGIADGSNVGFAAIFELNLADEHRVFAGTAHCSSLGVRRTGGTPISGQTMDTPAWFAELRVALRAGHEAGLTTLAFTVAGTPALCGINSAGVSVWCNAIYQLGSSPHGVPVACIVAHLLSSSSLDDAVAFAREVPHASGQHYLLGGPGGIVSLECSATSVVEERADGSIVWHANHPVASTGSLRAEAGGSSLARDAFMGRELTAAGSVDDLCAILADRTVPVSKLGEGGGDGYTLWAAVVEHGTPPSVLVSAGPPSGVLWEAVSLEPGHVQS